MSPKNQSKEEFPRPIDLLDKYRLSQPHIPTLVQRSVSRRSFLLTGTIGVTAIALRPWTDVLATPPDCKEILQGLIHKPQKKGFWATLLGILDIGASLFGFGGLIGTVQGLVQNLVANRRQLATSAITAALGGLNQQLPFSILNPPQSPWSTLGFTPLMPQIASDLRFFTQALNRDKFNGASLFFDHNNATNAANFDPKAIVSAPTTQALTISRCVFEALGYSGGDFKNAILAPTKQTDSGTAMGSFHQDYTKNDTYETRTGATIDVAYSNVNDSASGGSGEGEISLHGLEDRTASNKRMGIRRVAFSFVYPPKSFTPDGTTGFILRYVKGNTQSRF